MAERADRNKPMNIEADAMRYDDLKQTTVFTGRVVVTKGTIIIRGARIDVRHAAQPLNEVNWAELGFVCDGRHLFTQRSLETCLLPEDFPARLGVAVA